MKKLITKIIVVIMIVGLNWAGLSAVGQTFAYFFDNVMWIWYSRAGEVT